MAERRALSAYRTVLVDSFGATSNGHTCQQFLERLLQQALTAARTDMGNIQILDRACAALKIAVHRGFQPAFLEHFRIVADSECACGEALRTGQVVIVEDVTQSPVFRSKETLEVLLDSGIRAVQSTPMYSSSGILVGMLSTHYRQPHRPTEHELTLIRDLAGTAAEQIAEAKPLLPDSPFTVPAASLCAPRVG